MAKKTSSLTKRLLVMTLGVITSLCVLFLSSNYILTKQALDREVNRSLEYRTDLTVLALQERLKTTSEILQSLSQQSESIGQFNTSRLLKQLDAFTLSREGRYIDLIAIVHSDGEIQHNLSSPLIKDSEKFISEFNKTRAPNGWHLTITGPEIDTKAALMRGIALLDPNLGKVVGTLVYGVTLNDNAPLTNDLKNRAKVEGVQLLLNESLLSAPAPETEYQTNLSLRSPLGYQSGEYSLFIKILTSNQLLEDIDQAYILNALILLIFSLLAVLVMIVLIHRVTSTSFSKLVDYASEIKASQISLPYEPGNISEFNLLGSTLENLVHTLEVSQANLKQREQHISQIINSTAESIFGLDAEGICTFANNACIEKLGYLNPQDLVGTKMHDLMHYKYPDGSPYPESECPIYQSLLTGERVHNDQEVIWKANGSSFPAEYWSHPILENNKVTGAVITFFDITEKKHAEESLRRAQKMEAVGQLTGGIAHDFNNIMGIILGNVNLLKRQIKAEEDRSLLEIVETSAQRAVDLTKQLLSFSRKKTKEAKITNVNRVIKEMNSLIRGSLTPEVELQFFLSEQEQLAHIDPGDLGDAILNLVINARDSMPQGGQLIIETSHCKLDELYCLQNSGLVPGSYIQIVISDTGTGILPEQQERIFEPFFTTKSQGKGTGLGLAMTFGFAQRSGGTIKVYSELGLGTTFRLYLPLAEGEEEKNSPLLDHTLLPRGTENVLIVEDEPELLKLAQHYLIDLGYKVSCAENGVIALELLKKQPEIDLLFSDVVMPGGINGYQLAEMALALQPTIKILLTSGYTGRAIRNTEQAIFETKLISKPYTVNELSTQIRAVLGSPREEQREQDFDKKISETKLGVECYDQEHSQIMAFYERSKQLENGYIDADMSQLLIKITEYASNHLPLEETLMEACQYPGLSNHKQVHSLLLKQLELIKSRAQTGNLSANALSTFLADWWLDHILSMDSSAMTHCKQYPDTVERIVESHQSETNSKNHPDT